MQHSTGTFTGLYGTEIFTQQWQPESKPRAVILLVHGVGEHSGRYAHVAAHLATHGYAVCALDLRGHGRSGGRRVEVDAFDEYVVDVRTYFEQVRAAQPDVPLFLYGHSMGSLVALLFAARWQDELAGLILSGTALRALGQYGATKALLRALTRVIPRMRLILVPPNTISHDPGEVRRYVEDPLVSHRPVSVGQTSRIFQAAEAAEGVLPALRLPVLALHGGADLLSRPVSARLLRERCGSPDCTVIVYPGLRHEIHQEPERDQVLKDITAWLDRQVAARTAQTSADVLRRET